MEQSRVTIVFNGYVSAQTGYGAASRAYIHALHRAGIDISVVDRDGNGGRFVRDSLVASLLNRRVVPQFYVCHTAPQDIASMKRLFARLIVITAWETDKLPERYLQLLSEVSEIWVPSSHNVKIFRRQLKVPIFQIPHPVRPSSSLVDTTVINNRLGLKCTDFVFVSVISWQDRKCPLGIIEAFLRAFPTHTDIVLIIKTNFVFSDELTVRSQISGLVRTLGCSGAGNMEERIKIDGEYWPEELLHGLMRRANCYISLHRGEGWCYPLFDAACNGIPVIATAYSGPTDYLCSRYHHLVNYRLVPVKGADKFDFSEDMSWADPDIAHAASLMYHVYHNRQETVSQACEGAELLKTRYSLDVVGEMARTRMEGIVTRLSGNRDK